MKTIILGFTLLLAVFTGCSDSQKSADESSAKKADSLQENKNLDDTSRIQTASVDEVLNSYLELKNALANDKGNEAASAGKQMVAAMQKLNAPAFTSEQNKVYEEVKDDINEHAEHISTNGGKIEHQREHFDMLSKDMYDLVKAIKPSQSLYHVHCPMYNDRKGANWLSEIKEIKNPYYGKKMSDCGTIKEEITK